MRWFLVSASLVVLGTIILVSFASQAFDETHLKKLWALNGCVGCDLSGAYLADTDRSKADLREADLSGADLTGADLSTATLRNAKLDGAILCQTKTPWGIDNSGCPSCELARKFKLEHNPERCKPLLPPSGLKEKD